MIQPANNEMHDVMSERSEAGLAMNAPFVFFNTQDNGGVIDQLHRWDFEK